MEDGGEISLRTHLCLEEGHDIFELHVGINLDRERPAEVGDKRELHPEASY